MAPITLERGVGYRRSSTAAADRAMCVGFESSCANDTNGDGLVNFADLNNIIGAFNMGCP